MDTTFAEALRAAVQRSGKTQAQIAGEAGVDAGQYSRYLRRPR